MGEDAKKEQEPKAAEVQPSSGKFQGTRKQKEFAVRFRQNRSFELHVGRAVIQFGPNGEQWLPESVVQHPDFEQVRTLFSVREVK